MIAVSKIDDENKFRKDMFKSKRKALDEIWMGESIIGYPILFGLLQVPVIRNLG